MPEPIASGRRYMPGLDGLRTIAVLAVVAYHLGFNWAQGGLLGVAVFFTLSGYLITDLLLTQFGTHGRIDLRKFWTARARRLLPALYAMLIIVSVWTWADDRAQLDTVRGQVFAGLLYISNWWQSFQHISYFARFGPPSPLNHLWSLAVEEQFYLIWPLLVILLLKYVRERSGSGPFRPRMAQVALVLGAASAIEMAVLFHPGFDPSRVYYGTDTRAFGLLFGAALACVWPSRALTAQVGAHAGRVIDVVGVIGLVGIVVMIWRTTEYSQFLYRGGFVLLSLFTVMAIMALTHPAARLYRVMGTGPMRWLGVRSYGIYLWHAPIIALTTPNVDHGVQLWRAALQVAASIGIAALSWKYLEDPIRHGGMGAVKAMFKRPQRPQSSSLGPAASYVGGGGYGSAAPQLQFSASRSRSSSAASSTGFFSNLNGAGMALCAAVVVTVVLLTGAIGSPPFKPIVSDASLDLTGLGNNGGVNGGTNTTITASSNTDPRGRGHGHGNSSSSSKGGKSSAGAGKGSGSGSSKKNGRGGNSAKAGVTPGGKKNGKSSGGSGGPAMTSCKSVVHIGDSTSDGLISSDYLPDTKQQIPAQYERVGVKTVHMEVSGGTSIDEVALAGTENAQQVAEGLIQGGYNGCWVIALGTNDVADVAVGSNESLTYRIGLMMKILKGQDVMWVNDKTLLDSGPYAEGNMQVWDADLVQACTKYPNMRVYDWASVVKDRWFISDGIHYTSDGYANRGYMIANALARAFPANGHTPKSCVVHTESSHLSVLGLGNDDASTGTSSTTADETSTDG